MNALCHFCCFAVLFLGPVQLLIDWSSAQEPIKIDSGEINFGIALSPDNTLLASADNDSVIRLWEFPTGKHVADLRGHRDDPISVSFSSNGKLLASGGGHYRFSTELLIWDVAERKLRSRLIWNIRKLNRYNRFRPDGLGNIKSVAFAPDSYLLAAAHKSKVTLWNADSGEMCATLSAHTDNIIALAFSPDGKLLASGSVDDTARIWNVESGRELSVLRHEGNVLCVAFSPDGESLVTASDYPDIGIRLWDAESGEQRAELIRPSKAGRSFASLAFSPDGKIVASNGLDTRVRFTSVETAKTIVPVGPNNSSYTTHVGDVLFSRDGKYVVAAGGVATARFWKLDDLLNKSP